jgi:hypothetical protein
MTLREVLGGDEPRVHQQVDDLLDGDSGLIVFFDGDRMVSYVVGFGVSPCQLELLTVEVERCVRDVIGGQLTRTRTNRRSREKGEQGNNSSVGTALRQHLDRSGIGHHSGGSTEEVRVFGLRILPRGIVAGLLIVYFDWRAKLRRRVMAEHDGFRAAA